MGHSQIWMVVNTASVDIHVQVFVCMNVNRSSIHNHPYLGILLLLTFMYRFLCACIFLSLGEILRSRVSVLHAGCLFNFIRNFQISKLSLKIFVLYCLASPPPICECSLVLCFGHNTRYCLSS